MELGMLTAISGEMTLVWRVDEIGKLRREFEAAKTGIDIEADDWAYGHDDDDEEAEQSAWITFLLGPDASFYCGNGVPYNWTVEPYELGTPMFTAWSDD